MTHYEIYATIKKKKNFSISEKKLYWYLLTNIGYIGKIGAHCVYIVNIANKMPLLLKYWEISEVKRQ